MATRDFLLIITSIGAIQSMLLGLYFLSSGYKKNNADLILGTLLMALGIRVAKSTFYIFSESVTISFFNLGFAAHATVGPLLALYVKYCGKRGSIPWREVLHFVPAFLLLLFTNSLGLDNFWYAGGYAALLYQSLGYILFSIFIFINRAQKLEKQKKTWLLQLTIGVSLFLLAYFSNYILGLTSYVLAPVINTFVIYLISYFLLVNYNSLFNNKSKKYKHLNINDEMLADYRNRVESVLTRHKPFLSADFNLSKLSELTGIPGYTLSYVFNNHLGKKFSDFINEYRIQEAKRKLTDPKNDHFKISSIAYECGFSSLSAFNAAFKKFTQTTPSQFRTLNHD